MKMNNKPGLMKWMNSFQILFILISAGIIAGGVLFYLLQKKEIILRKSSEITSFAEIKVEQISDFRNERLSEARFIYGNQSFIKTVNNFIKKTDSLSQMDIMNWLSPIAKNHMYNGIFIIDAKTKKNVMTIGSDKFSSDKNLEYGLQNCLESGEIKFGKLTLYKNDIYLPVFTPIIKERGSSLAKIAVVVFIIDPHAKLFNLIQSFPSESKTGEILVVRKDGDDVLYLNELRFKKNTALKFRLPLSDEDLPAASSLRGNHNASFGTDYRGKKVLAVSRPVPGSVWNVIVKMDRSEVFQGLRGREIIIGSIIILLILIVGLIFKNLYELKQKKELAILNEKFVCSNEALKESNERIKRVNQELIIAREKAEESDRLKSAFLANMSHEIRTPMNAIVGFSELMNNPRITKEEIKEYTSIITLKCNELLHLISDILDISKIESNTVTLNFEIISLNEFLYELHLVYKRRLGQLNKKHINLTYTTPSGQKQFPVSTDVVKFRQIFTNLLENAVKYTESGEISFGYKSHNANHLECFVSDTGIGIDPAHHTNIFEMFRQDNKVEKNYGGTGLGLAICKGNSHLLGGNIWVKSEPGKGSTFYFSINYNQNVQISFNQEKPLLRNKVNIMGKDKNILIVEDDPYTVEYVKKIVSEYRINLHIARNGKETQEYYKKLNEIDLVLLDIRLPDASGYNIAKQIKSLRKDLPVIAQTAFAMENDQKKCIEAGCDDYISKPFKREKIIEIINSYTGFKAEVS